MDYHCFLPVQFPYIVALACLGKYLKGSGAENNLIQSAVFGVNVTDSVLSGKNYVRSLKGLQLLKE